MRYRYILETVTYNRNDINGNRRWYARLTSTETGKSVDWKTAHSGNAVWTIQEALGTGSFWSVGYHTQSRDGIQNVNRMRRNAEFSDDFDPELRDRIHKLCEK